MLAVAGDGAPQALARLESLARLAAPESSARGLRELVASAAHIVVHVARYADGSRRVASIAEVSGTQGESYAVRELFQFQIGPHVAGEAVRGRHVGAGVVPRFYSELEARGEKADSALFR
jgi:pilus assembly protein CpaF